jgi:WD40 repeat protein
VFVHVHLLRDGRVLAFGKVGDPQVWNPVTGSFTAVPSASLVFCAGHDFLPNGNVLVAGGHMGSSKGLPNTNTFDVAAGSWVVGPPMAKARWYPTNTTLPNGEVVTLSGEDENGATVLLPEVWNGSSWRQLTTASLALPNYPRTFVAPDGRVFAAGSDAQTRFLDVTGTGSWTNGPQRKFGSRSYGAAVMYEPGKIMYVGGANPPTATAEIIDLNQPNPQWTFTGSLATARWNLNATILPTGDVLVTGGASGDRSNPANAVNTTELWSPVSGGWTTVAPSASLLRGYHSTSLLLPDGRVLHAGGGDGASTPNNLNYELYSPPYLFRGARPVVTGVTPNEVTYGQSFTLETADATSITKVNLIRFGSVTHAFDAGSRLVPLSYTRVSGGISVTIPSSRAMAPPGPYMLFLVNGNGVPSIARIMLVR